jgi:hypothetical protein
VRERYLFPPTVVKAILNVGEIAVRMPIGSLMAVCRIADKSLPKGRIHGFRTSTSLGFSKSFP